MGETEDSSQSEKDLVISNHKAVAGEGPLDVVQLEAAYEHRVVYILGKEEMFIKPKTKIPRRILLSMFLFLRDMTRSKMANVKVPTERLVEIGFIKQV